MAPQDLKDALFAAFQASVISAIQASFGSAIDSAYDAGVASVPSSGFSQAQVDQMLADAKAALKLQVKASLQSMEAGEESVIDAL